MNARSYYLKIFSQIKKRSFNFNTSRSKAIESSSSTLSDCDRNDNITNKEKMAQRSLRDSIYMTDNPDESTFMYDNQLPNLPVPTVQQSIEKLLDTIKPIATDDKAYKETERKAMEFLRDPIVDELQESLQQRAHEHKNWLEDWWLEFAYLRSRKPLIPYSNMAGPLPELKAWPIINAGQEGHQGLRAKRAALTTYFQLCFWRMLREEKMRPMVHRGVPWSMNQFRYLFNTVRVPGDSKDELLSWFRTAREGPPESTEIIVICRGYIFAIKPVTMQGTRAFILPAPLIEKQLKQIELWCRDRPFGPGVGALTVGERSDWAEARQNLARICDGNKRILDRIDRALSVMVLEDLEPKDFASRFHNSMCGDARNRWADKSITSIVFRNGSFGASADHTPFDGFSTNVMTHYLITSVEECNGEWTEQMASNSELALYVEPEALEFKLDTQVTLSIDEAVAQSASINATIDVMFETFNHFGKAILKEHKIHPEAFVQCGLHSAYYRQQNKMAPTYVTASTRRFHNGRTETCRSCYPEMQDFVKFLAQYGSSKPKEAYDLLKKSATKYQTLMNEASHGLGLDRHLLGLYLVAMLENKKLPELFEDELVLRTKEYILSTSFGGYWNLCGGVPPLVEDGYGCFYAIEDYAITISLTSYKPCPTTDLGGFYKHLIQSLLDMHKVLLTAQL